MKKYSKIILSSIFLGLALVLVACSGTKKDQKAKQNESTYSNLNNKKSVEEVKSLLSAHLDKDSVGTVSYTHL